MREHGGAADGRTSQEGYAWDGYDAVSIAEILSLPYVETLAEVDSTLDVAHERAAREWAPAPAGALILADTQRAGRGRMGRSWASEPGGGVWCTMIERPEPAALDVLSIRVGLGIAERLDTLAGAQVGVKWPNDLVVNGGKLGGILIEARWSGDALSWVAIGVGVNVRPPADVERAVGLPEAVRRMDVLQAVVRGIRDAAEGKGALSADELARYASRDVLARTRLASPSAGRAAGITNDGALIIHTRNGVEQHRTGTVVLQEDAER